MAKSATERSREWREKRANRGGRSLSVWLDADTAQKLDELTAQMGKVADVIAQAIDALHSVASNICMTEKPMPLFDQPEESAPVASNKLAHPAQTIHPALAEIKQRIDAGEDVNDLRAQFSEAANALTEEGLSQRKIAALLNEADVPTFSGSGKWGKSTIGRLLKSTISVACND